MYNFFIKQLEIHKIHIFILIIEVLKKNNIIKGHLINDF